MPVKWVVGEVSDPIDLRDPHGMAKVKQLEVQS
jgi:hypothetical protein